MSNACLAHRVTCILVLAMLAYNLRVEQTFLVFQASRASRVALEGLGEDTVRLPKLHRLCSISTFRA